MQTKEFILPLGLQFRAPQTEDVRPDPQTGQQIKYRRPAITIHEGCKGCGMCAEVCPKDALTPVGRGKHKKTGEDLFTIEYNPDVCIQCGKCVLACKHGIITETYQTKDVKDVLADESKHQIVQFAPAVRLAYAQKYSVKPQKNEQTGQMMPPGDVAIRKLYWAAKNLLGFKVAWDTSVAADFVTIAETDEFIKRVTDKTGKYSSLPMFTSCCPGWIENIKIHHPEFIPNVSTCKPPQAVVGTLAKTYYAEKTGMDPHAINVTAVMPCVTKKQESAMPYLNAAAKYNGHNGDYPDVDHVITSREFELMMNEELAKRKMTFADIPVDMGADPMLGEYSKSGVNFGMTGGVARAVLEEASRRLDGKPIDQSKVKFQNVTVDGQEYEHIKTADVTIHGIDLTVAVADGTQACDTLLDLIKKNKIKTTICEFMNCEEGCANGCGQFYNEQIVKAVKTMRAKQEEEAKQQALSPAQERVKILGEQSGAGRDFGAYSNPAVKSIIEDWAGGLDSHKLEALIHITERYPDESYKLKNQDVVFEGDRQPTLADYLRWGRLKGGDVFRRPN